MEIKQQLQAAKLQQAIATATEAVRLKPLDIQKRQLLCELLCISGDLVRADKHWDAIVEQSPKTAISVLPLRQLVRAQHTRQACFHEGGLPDVLYELTEAQKLILQSMIEIRQHEYQQAAAYMVQAEARLPVVAGLCNGKAFTSIRDCDDLCSGFLEVLTTEGKYHWIAFEQMASITFQPPEQPLDLIWRRASLILHDDSLHEVYVPAIYINTPAEQESARLGYMTDWQIKNDGPVTGIGQRLFLLDDVQMPIMEINHLIFESPGVI